MRGKRWRGHERGLWGREEALCHAGESLRDGGSYLNGYRRAPLKGLILTAAPRLHSHPLTGAWRQERSDSEGRPRVSGPGPRLRQIGARSEPDPCLYYCRIMLDRIMSVPYLLFLTCVPSAIRVTSVLDRDHSCAPSGSGPDHRSHITYLSLTHTHTHTHTHTDPISHLSLSLSLLSAWIAAYALAECSSLPTR